MNFKKPDLNMYRIVIHIISAYAHHLGLQKAVPTAKVLNKSLRTAYENFSISLRVN